MTTLPTKDEKKTLLFHQFAWSVGIMSIILISTFVAYRLVVDDSVAILLMVILMLFTEVGGVAGFFLLIAYTIVKPWRKCPSPCWFSWRVMFCYAYALVGGIVFDVRRSHSPPLELIRQELPFVLTLAVVVWNCCDYINYDQPPVAYQLRQSKETVEQTV